MEVLKFIVKWSLFLVPVVIILLGSMMSVWYVANESSDTNWKKQFATALRVLASWLDNSTDVVEVDSAPECQPNAEFIDIVRRPICKCKNFFLSVGESCIADICHPGMNEMLQLRNATCVKDPNGEGHMIVCIPRHVVIGNETSCTAAPPGWQMGSKSGIYYKKLQLGLTRSQAIKMCSEKGGRLMRIEDKQKAEELYNASYHSGLYHVDAQLDESGEMIYNDGTPGKMAVSALNIYGHPHLETNACLCLYKDNQYLLYRRFDCKKLAHAFCELRNML